MTKKLTVSLPDDVAARLAEEENVSAYVTEAVRRRMRGERARELLAAAGVEVHEDGVARARAALAEARDRVTPELRTRAADLYAQVTKARG